LFFFYFLLRYSLLYYSHLSYGGRGGAMGAIKDSESLRLFVCFACIILRLS